MALAQSYRMVVSGSAALLNPLQPLLLLSARLYVSWQFLKSGYLKITSWDTTLYLFENEYHVPLLSPHLAAVMGAFGEICFPLFLIVGLFGRLGALGVFFVNAMAVISYSGFLFRDGNEAALAQHVLWGTICGFLIILGPGKWSLDEILLRTSRGLRAR
jgi:putative oxidoreductase